jgi:hypothetical protein
MTRSRSTRLGAPLALALGLIALLALTGPAAAKDSRDDNVAAPGQTATIASFDQESGRLVIGLSGGEEIAGLVTNRTRIRCEDEHAHDSGHHRRHRHGRDDSARASRSHGEAEPGDDRGGENSGQGRHDDNGRGANCTSADLVVGAAVEEVELEFRRGQAVFREVELVD